MITKSVGANCSPRLPNELIKCIESSTFEEQENKLNKFIEEENPWIREIRPVAWSTQTCVEESLDEGISKWRYQMRFGIIVRYELRQKESKYVPTACTICGASEDDRQGRYLDGKFICVECLREKLNI